MGRPRLQAPFPVPIIGGQPVVITETGAAVPVKAKPGVVIKQIVKQEVGTSKARKKRVTSARGATLKQVKSEYHALKKGIRKRITQLKKEAYSAETSRIKGLPSKERAAARKALRARLKKEFDDKLKQVPSLGRKKYSDIVALIHKIKRIKL